jgi:Domain of unknown function (DUF4124)
MTFRVSHVRFLGAALVMAGLFASTVARADDTLYKCVDEHGATTFTNTGSTKGCTKLNVDPVVIPKLATPASKQATPAGYPKVDPSTQKVRDNDRRRILEDELRDKEAQLAQLRQEYNNGAPERQGNERNYQRYLDRRDRLKDDIARAENDVASIRNELSKVQ